MGNSVSQPYKQDKEQDRNEFWHLHDAESSNKKYSVFIHNKNKYTEAVQKHAEKQKGVHHPFILQFVTKYETQTQLYIVTEHVRPQSQILLELENEKEYEQTNKNPTTKQSKAFFDKFSEFIKDQQNNLKTIIPRGYGIQSILLGLSNLYEACIFLHEKNNLAYKYWKISSIYIDDNNNWKLGNFISCEPLSSYEHDLQEFYNFCEIICTNIYKILQYNNTIERNTLDILIKDIKKAKNMISINNTIIYKPLESIPYIKLLQEQNNMLVYDISERLQIYTKILDWYIFQVSPSIAHKLIKIFIQHLNFGNALQIPLYYPLYCILFLISIDSVLEDTYSTILQTTITHLFTLKDSYNSILELLSSYSSILCHIIDKDIFLNTFNKLFIYYLQSTDISILKLIITSLPYYNTFITDEQLYQQYIPLIIKIIKRANSVDDIEICNLSIFSTINVINYNDTVQILYTDIQERCILQVFSEALKSKFPPVRLCAIRGLTSIFKRISTVSLATKDPIDIVRKESVNLVTRFVEYLQNQKIFLDDETNSPQILQQNTEKNKIQITNKDVTPTAISQINKQNRGVLQDLGSLAVSAFDAVVIKSAKTLMEADLRKKQQQQRKEINSANISPPDLENKQYINDNTISTIGTYLNTKPSNYNNNISLYKTSDTTQYKKSEWDKEQQWDTFDKNCNLNSNKNSEINQNTNTESQTKFITDIESFFDEPW